MPIRVTVDSASSLKAHMLAPEHRLVGDPYGASSLRVNSGRYTELTPPIFQDAVAFWPLASDGNVDLKDYVGGHDLTNNGGVTRADGPSTDLPDAANFVAEDGQSLSSTYVPDISNGFTFLVWARVEDNDDGYALGGQWLTTGGQRSWRLTASSAGDWRLQYSTDGAETVNTSSGVSATPEEFVFFSVRYKPGVLQFSRNLVEVNSFNVTLHKSTAPLALGSDIQGSLPLNGRLTSALFAETWIGDAQLAWLYNGGDGRNLLSLV